jgi:hypothetical protein
MGLRSRSEELHQASHAAPIVPILIAAAASTSPSAELIRDSDGVYRPLPVHPAEFRPAVDRALGVVTGNLINEDYWPIAPYRPTPTIVEAARALYAQHSVEAIARYDAGALNLRTTSSRVEELVDDARLRNRKIICFVTGVPGAGKDSGRAEHRHPKTRCGTADPRRLPLGKRSTRRRAARSTDSRRARAAAEPRGTGTQGQNRRACQGIYSKRSPFPG